MGAILEAIDQELAVAEEQVTAAEVRVTHLRELREKAGELEGGGMAETSPAPVGDRSKPKRKTQPRSAPPKAEANQDRKAAVAKHLRESGEWCRPAAIAEAIGVDVPALKSAFRALLGDGAIRKRGHARGTEYQIADQATTAGANGASTRRPSKDDQRPKAPRNLIRRPIEEPPMVPIKDAPDEPEGDEE